VSADLCSEGGISAAGGRQQAVDAAVAALHRRLVCLRLVCISVRAGERGAARVGGGSRCGGRRWRRWHADAAAVAVAVVRCPRLRRRPVRSGVGARAAGVARVGGGSRGGGLHWRGRLAGAIAVAVGRCRRLHLLQVRSGVRVGEGGAACVGRCSSGVRRLAALASAAPGYCHGRRRLPSPCTPAGADWCGVGGVEGGSCWWRLSRRRATSALVARVRFSCRKSGTRRWSTSSRRLAHVRVLCLTPAVTRRRARARMARRAATTRRHSLPISAGRPSASTRPKICLRRCCTTAARARVCGPGAHDWPLALMVAGGTRFVHLLRRRHGGWTTTRLYQTYL